MENLFNIVAPVCSVQDVAKVTDAGANEVYFGLMTKDWVLKYGNADFISRRQSEFSHLSELRDLDEIAKIARDRNCKSTLVLNSNYTGNQIPYILDIISYWEGCGGHSLMLADMNILLSLNERHRQLELHLSVLAGVFNSYSVNFFNKLGISRIVLPRELKMAEMKRIIVSAGDKMEYEIIAMFQKCEFIDSFCHFYHGFCYQPFVMAEPGDMLKDKNLPVINCLDINYEGHGCQLDFTTCNNNHIKHLNKNEFDTPYCAACQLKQLSGMGINSYKIAGRGYPVDLIVKAITFLRSCLAHKDCSLSDIKAIYKSIFGTGCHERFCYYH